MLKMYVRRSKRGGVDVEKGGGKFMSKKDMASVTEFMTCHFQTMLDRK